MADCYIWDTPAEMPRDADGQSVYLDSPRAGGKYKITGTAASLLGNLGINEKARLTTWLCNQRRAGIEFPAVTSDVLNFVRTTPPLTTTERVERTSLHFNQKIRVGEAIEFSFNNYRGEPEALRLMAISESLNLDEIIAFLQMMEQMSLLLDATQVIGLYPFERSTFPRVSGRSRAPSNKRPYATTAKIAMACESGMLADRKPTSAGKRAPTPLPKL